MKIRDIVGEAKVAGPVLAVQRVVNNPAFRAWFGASKVVDAKGLPLVCFHGAKTPFDEFNPASDEFSAIQGLGNWFASKPRAANYFSMSNPDWEYDGDQPHVIPVFLRIENPFVVEGWDGLMAAFAPNGYYEEDIYAKKEEVIRSGHDGIIMLNSTTDRAGKRTDFVIFQPKQAKSIFAREFNPANAKLSETLTSR